jgi:hypothetical protein
MACGVAKYEPYRACMGIYWPQINQRNSKCQNIDELRTAYRSGNSLGVLCEA